MNFRKNILFSKKFIIFLMMILSYAVSSASPLKEEKIIKEIPQKTFIIKQEYENPGKYYVSENRDTSVHIYENKENKYEEGFTISKIKDLFYEEIFNNFFEPYLENLVFFFYDIATDINRSLRN